MQTTSFKHVLGLLCAWLSVPAWAEGELWLTNPDRSALFKKQDSPLAFAAVKPASPVIEVDDTQIYQTVDGFGFTLTGGSAMHLVRMEPAARAALLRELFATDSTNIGTSYLRLSIGASDLNERVFSYADLPAGQTDPELKWFDLGPDRMAPERDGTLHDGIPGCQRLRGLANDRTAWGTSGATRPLRDVRHETRAPLSLRPRSIRGGACEQP